MTEPQPNLLTATAELPDDAAYAWWRNSHPAGFILALRARKAPLLHRARCDKVDRDRHPGGLKAAGSRQICAGTIAALRTWLAREAPGAAPAVLARCPKCAP